MLKMLIRCYINFIFMSKTIHAARWSRKSNSQIRNNSTALIDSLNDSFKLPAINALNKSIKYGDLSFSTNKDTKKLRKQPEQVDNIEELSAHQSLMIIRNKYDNMNKTKQARQKDVRDMEIQRDKYLTQRNRFQEEKTKGLAKVQGLDQSLQAIKHQLEDSEIEKKVMFNMIERIKSDKIVYDLRKYRLEKELLYIKKQKDIILKQNAIKMEEEDKTRKIHQKLMDHLQAQKNERDAHINSLLTMIGQKVALNENAQLRNAEMKQIAENTMQDKDPQEKNWYNVHLANRFLDKLLRDKMNREMNKFNTVQTAFKNIKTSTGVSNTQQLVKKFLSKESAYGELLGKIAENERGIVDLKGENEQLMKERTKLKTEQDVLNSNRAEMKGLEKEEKVMHQMDEKATHCELMIEKLRTWGAKNIKKFNLIDNISDEVEIKKKNGEIVQQLKVFLQRMTKELDSIKQISIKQDPNVQLGGNNIRITLNTTNEQQMQQNTPNEKEEQNFMNSQRQELMRNNEKFMKDVRKKYQEIKRAKIDAQPKKKEIVVVEKPKPQPV